MSFSDPFPGHEPGQPYTLTRRQFCRFLEELWDAHHWAEPQRALRYAPEGRDRASFWEVWDYLEDWGAESASARAALRSVLWEQITAAEAGRSFDRGMGGLWSDLRMDRSLLQWCYYTTSGTVLVAADHRFDDGDSVVKGSDSLIEELSGEDVIPEGGLYKVTIPAHRDQPGRTAWVQLRLAASGLPHAYWCQEQEAEDGPIAQRRELKDQLYALREKPA